MWRMRFEPCDRKIIHRRELIRGCQWAQSPRRVSEQERRVFMCIVNED